MGLKYTYDDRTKTYGIYRKDIEAEISAHQGYYD